MDQLAGREAVSRQSIRLLRGAFALWDCTSAPIECLAIGLPYRCGSFLVGSEGRFGRLGGAGLAFQVRGGRILTRGFAGLPGSVTLSEFSAALEQFAR
jgi:hypothetical protein